MCGITGFQTFKKVNFDSQKKIEIITKILDHRGPDSVGYWHNESKNIYLGHTRLSIIDLSPHGNQPMQSLDGRYVMVFNGEIYNYRFLKEKLIKKFNIKFRNETDTTVLLESISLIGLKKTIQSLEGMFAFALYDKKQDSIYLVRDRFGEKPLFYFLDNNFLIFASELKSIKNFFNNTKLRINSLSCQLFSCLGYIPAPLTIYEQTFKVMPAEIIKFSSGKILYREKYYDSNQPIYETYKESKVENIQNLIESSVKKMMVADVEVGCFLSGGIDSSLIASLMQKNSSKKIKTFTIGFEEQQFDESKYARNIAEYLGTDHNEMIVSMNDLLSNIENVSEVYDEPFGDSSFLPTEILCKHASKSLKVVLSGDGGDEIFLGYNRYLLSKKIERFNMLVPYKVRFLLQKLMKIIPPGLYDYLSLPLQKKFGLHGFSHKVQKLTNLLSYYDDIDFYKKLNLIDNSKFNLIENYNIFQKYDDLLRSTQINDINYYLSNDILVKVDRASMSNSLEVRSPFLDSVLANEALKIPSDLKMKNQELKYILKTYLEKFIPKKLFKRPKMGFAIPLDVWLNKKKVINLFDDVFNNSDWEKLSMDSRNIKKIWKSYKSFKKHTPTIIWNYAVAGLWLKNN